MKTVDFLRHAESTGNVGLPTSEPSDIPLTPAGRDAAETAARNYEGPAPDLIVVSPFRRAPETSEPFKRCYPAAAVEEWSIQEFTYLSPASCQATTSGDRLPLVEAYWRNAIAEQVEGAGAESFLQFLERVQTALTKLRDRREQAILVSRTKCLSRPRFGCRHNETHLGLRNHSVHLPFLSRSLISDDIFCDGTSFRR